VTEFIPLTLRRSHGPPIIADVVFDAELNIDRQAVYRDGVAAMEAKIAEFVMKAREEAAAAGFTVLVKDTGLMDEPDRHAYRLTLTFGKPKHAD
jgi:hypothetical protein